LRGKSRKQTKEQEERGEEEEEVKTDDEEEEEVVKGHEVEGLRRRQEAEEGLAWSVLTATPCGSSAGHSWRCTAGHILNY